jgi:hypothetical protein
MWMPKHLKFTAKMNTLYTEWPTSALYTVLHLTNINVLHTAERPENVALDWRGVSDARNFSGPWESAPRLNFCYGGRAGCGAVAPTDDLGYSLQCLVPRVAPVVACNVTVGGNSWLPVSVSFSTYTVTRPVSGPRHRTYTGWYVNSSRCW